MTKCNKITDARIKCSNDSFESRYGRADQLHKFVKYSVFICRTKLIKQ